MGIGILNSKPAEVNGAKPKSLHCRRIKWIIDSKRTEKDLFLARLSKSFIGVFCDDFAAVDVREELCYHSRPKKHKFGGYGRINHSKRTISPK